MTYAGDQYAVLVTSSSQQHQGNARSHSIHTTPHGDGTFTSRLTVSGVDEADAGLYVCVIVGRHGGRSFRSAFLTVAGKRTGQGEPTGTENSLIDYLGHIYRKSSFHSAATLSQITYFHPHVGGKSVGLQSY